MNRHVRVVSRFGRLLCLAEIVLLLTSLSRSVLADAEADYGVALSYYKQQSWDRAAQAWGDFLKRNPNSDRLPLAKLYYGQALVQLGKYSDARDVFRDYVTRYPKQPDIPLAQYRIAECSVFLNDLDAAERELRTFLTQNPNHDLAEWAYQYQGEVFAKRGQNAEAAAAFRQLLTRFKTGKLSEDARFGLARAEEQLKNTPAAIELYKELAAMPQGRFAAESLFNLGSRYFADQKYPEAIQEFTAIGKRFPQHPLAAAGDVHAGYVQFQLKQFPAAIEQFQKAVQSPAQGPTASFWIGLSYKEEGDFAKAAETFRQLDPSVKQTKPLGPEVAFHWGDSEFRLLHFDQARELFLEAVRRDPASEQADDALYLASDAAVRGGRLPDAIRIYEQFRRDYPNSGLALLEELVRGRALLAQGDELEKSNKEAATAKWNAAAEVFAHVARESTLPQTATLARIQLARLKARSRDDQGVVDTLAPLKKELTSENVPPEYSEALLLLANSLNELKRGQESIEVYKLYRERSPGKRNPAALTALAIASAQLGHWEDARSAVKSLSEADERKEDLVYASAEVGDKAFRAEQWELAAEMFRYQVDLGPQHPGYWTALSDLGHTYINMKRWKEAAQALEGVLESKSTDLPILSHITYLYGYALQQEGENTPSKEQLAAAASVFEKAFERFQLPADVTKPSAEQLETSFNAFQAARGAARSLAKLDKPHEADAFWQKAYDELARQTDPQRRQLDAVLSEWGAMHNNAGNAQRADELFQKLVTDFPNSAHSSVAQLSIAQGAVGEGKIEQAIETFTKLAQSAEVHEDVRRTAMVWLIDVSAQAKNWQNALKYAVEFTRKFPQDDLRFYARYRQAEALLQLAVSSSGGGPIEPGRGSEQIDEAVRLLVELKQGAKTPLPSRKNAQLESEEWFRQVWLLLAEAYFRIRNYTAVEANVDELRAEDPESPFLYQMDEILGRSFQKQAQFEQARAAYLRVIESPDGKRTETAAKAQLALADTYLFQKNYEEAHKEYYKVYAVYLYPEYQAAALSQAISCDLQLKRPADAAKTLETLKTEFPDSEYTRSAEKAVKMVLDKTGTTPMPTPADK